MARKQQLINYHTSKAIMPQAVDVQLGEIVVRHATDKPELLIKKDNNEFATFVDSGKVQSMITASSTDLQGQIDDISKDLKDNYATSASTEAAIKAVDTKLTTKYATSADTEAAISAVDTKLTTKYATSASTEAAIKAVDTKLTTNYADSASTEAAIKAVDTKLTTYYATSADTETAIKAVDGKVGTLSGNVHTRIESLETELTNTINNKVAVAYRYQGTKTNYADLPTSEMSEDTIGFVYNVENANGNYPAGTNYAWNGTEWDALGGSVDLSPYATSASVKTEIDGIKQTTTNLQSAIDSVSSATKTLVSDVSAATKATYATKTELEATSGSIISDYTTAIGAAKKAVYDSATTVAAADAKTKADTAYSSAVTAAAASADTLNTSIETVSGSVSAFSATVVSDYATKVMASGYATTAEANAVASGKGYTDGQISAVITAYTQADKDLDARIDKLEAISADTQSAVQNVVVYNTDANKITATKADATNVVTLNFDNMVIDCGDF